MDAFERTRLSDLREALKATLQEKSGIANENASSATTRERKQLARRRYPFAQRKFRAAMIDLEGFLTAARQAEIPKHSR